MNKKYKEIENDLRNMVDNFEHNKHKENALKEFKEIRKTHTLDDVKHISFIIDQYPEFDSIELRCSNPGKWILRMNINPEILKADKRAFKKTVKMVYQWSKKGKRVC